MAKAYWQIFWPCPAGFDAAPPDHVKARNHDTKNALNWKSGHKHRHTSILAHRLHRATEHQQLEANLQTWGKPWKSNGSSMYDPRLALLHADQSIQDLSHTQNHSKVTQRGEGGRDKPAQTNANWIKHAICNALTTVFPRKARWWYWVFSWHADALNSSEFNKITPDTNSNQSWSQWSSHKSKHRTSRSSTEPGPPTISSPGHTCRTSYLDPSTG